MLKRILIKIGLLFFNVIAFLILFSSSGYYFFVFDWPVDEFEIVINIVAVVFLVTLSITIFMFPRK